MRALSPRAGQAIDGVTESLLIPPDEARARGLAERLARLLAAGALQTWGREEVAAILLRSRLAGGGAFGASDCGFDARRLRKEARLAVGVKAEIVTAPLN